MIITFATQKGGAGKTTLAIAFANYLALQKKEIHVFDFDFQKSFYNKWMEDEDLNLPKLYEVQISEDNQAPFSDFETLMKMKSDDAVYLFDLAGTLDMKYTDILQYSDFIIIPFEYSDISSKSTLVFINFLGLLESEAGKIFIRSRYEKNFEYPNKPMMDEEISRFGKLITQPVLKRNILQKINTRSLKGHQRRAVKDVFSEVMEHIEKASKDK